MADPTCRSQALNLSSELRRSTDVILKKEIDISTVASGVLHASSVSQTYIEET